MKRSIWGAFILLSIISIYSGITSAFFGDATSQKPISEATSLLLLGSGLLVIATWGRKKFR